MHFIKRLAHDSPSHKFHLFSNFTFAVFRFFFFDFTRILFVLKLFLNRSQFSILKAVYRYRFDTIQFKVKMDWIFQTLEWYLCPNRLKKVKQPIELPFKSLISFLRSPNIHILHPCMPW